jgi:mannosyltransferase OCH1-like enzyme
MEIWNDNKRRDEKMTQPQSDVIDYIKSLNYRLVKSIEDDFIFEPYEPIDISFSKNIQKNDKFVTQYLEDITDESLFYIGTMQQNSYDLITSSEFPELDFETKQDLIRYDTLYNKGGLFADTNVIAFHIDKLYDYDLVLVKGELFQNNIILAKPGCELFKKMYDLLLKNVQNGVRTDYKKIFHNEVTAFIEGKNVKILHTANSKLNQVTKKYFGLPKGSWINSSVNYSMNGNILTVDCADCSGNWIRNDVIIAPGVEYCNDNGIMKCLPFTSYLDNDEVFFTSVVLYETTKMEEHLNKKIFMTYKKNVPNKVFKRWKVLNPGYDIDFNLDAECIEFLEKTNGYLASLFKEIPIGMYKADLWRLCKLYTNGGVYADVDLVPYLNLDYLDTDVTFYSCMSIFQNSIFQAFMVNHKPKSGLLYLMILSFLLNNPQNNCIGPTFDMFNVLQYNISEPIQTLKKYHLNTVKLEIKIGSSSVNEKRINLFYFPLEKYDFQLKPNPYNDLFEFSVKNNILTVKRIDIDSGWGYHHSCELIIKSREVIYLFK